MILKLTVAEETRLDGLLGDTPDEILLQYICQRVGDYSLSILLPGFEVETDLVWDRTKLETERMYRQGWKKTKVMEFWRNRKQALKAAADEIVRAASSTEKVK
jgi:hypothetical protein